MRITDGWLDSTATKSAVNDLGSRWLNLVEASQLSIRQPTA